MFQKSLIVMPEQIFQTKEEVLDYLTHLENGRVSDPDGYARDVQEREATFATYIFEGIATPHAKSEFVKEPFVVYAKLAKTVHWGDDEGEDADLIFLLGVPKTGENNEFANLHLKVLAVLSKNLVHEDFRESLRAASTTDEVYDLLKKIEEDI